MREGEVHGEMGIWILISFTEVRNAEVAGWGGERKNCKLNRGCVDFEQSKEYPNGGRIVKYAGFNL